MRWWLPVLLLALAGCGGGAPAPQPSPTPTANAYAAKVAALPDRLRAGVLLRAIRDAGQACQAIVAQQPAAGASPPSWIATCDDQHRWVVAIAADGTAQVVDAADLANRR